MNGNPEFHSCCTCGYTWRHGHHGGHSCSTYLQKEIDRLLLENKELKKLLQDKEKG